MPLQKRLERLIAELQQLAPDVLLAEIGGNSLLRIAIAALAAAVLALVTTATLRLVKRRVRKMSARTRLRWDEAVVRSLDAVRSSLVLLLSGLVCALILVLPDAWEQAVRGAALLVLFIQVGLYLHRLLKEGLRVWAESETSAPKTILGALEILGKILVWSAVVLLALSTLGIEISALVAGLGIGGIAAALAVQNVLGDIFSAFSLYTDRPFDVGDFIIVGDDLGTIQQIGWRTTRVSSLHGQETVFPNSELTSTRIQNYSRMRERRIAFDVGIVYATPTERVEEVPSLIRQAIECVSNARFDRSHLKGFGPSSLDFESVYFVLSHDYSVYRDVHQKILLGILSAFRDRGITIAFPSRSLYLETVPERFVAPLSASGDRPSSGHASAAGEGS
jgi:small-conductance mechanosensitive channel